MKKRTIFLLITLCIIGSFDSYSFQKTKSIAKRRVPPIEKKSKPPVAKPAARPPLNPTPPPPPLAPANN